MVSKKRLPKPSPGELEVLQVLWEDAPATVKQVHESLAARQHPPKRMTTTLKLMQIMEEKGLIVREGAGRPQLFRPVLTQRSAQSGFVEDVLHRVFQGNVGKMVLHALEDGKISRGELDEIQALIDAHRKKRDDTQ